jgi:hypothetical protein
MFEKKPRLSRRSMLASVPCLNPAVRWEELDSGCLMAVYKRHGRGVKKLLLKLSGLPEVGQLALDEAGTRVVRRIDGVNTVNDLIGYVAEEFKLSRKEAEVSTLKYMEMLGQRSMIGFAVPSTEGER